MRTLVLTPSEVKSYGSCKNGIPNYIFVGECFGSRKFYARLLFPPIEKTPEECVKKAVLRLFCKDGWRLSETIAIRTDGDKSGQSVNGPGFYEWDVTLLARAENWGGEEIVLFTGKGDGCSYKEFEAAGGDGPRLFVTLEEKETPRPANIVREVVSCAQEKHTPSVDCIFLTRYYYFVKNNGTGSVTLNIEISPGNDLFVTDSGPYEIHPGETAYLLPLRPSAFLRLSFKNTKGFEKNPLLVWFQGI
jgi:hypothetical protein